MWPGLALRMDDSDTRKVVDRYAQLSAPIFESGGDFPTHDQIWMAVRRRGLFDQ